MEKNKYLVINDLIFDMYLWKELSDIKVNFFQLLRLIVPFSYASIMLKDQSIKDDVKLTVFKCYPEEFSEAEYRYLTYEYADDLGWNLYAHESKVIRESDIVDEERRFHTPMYKDCYEKYDIYDNLQLTICYNGELYGVLTLFSTRQQGAYSAEDMFFLRSVGMHINANMSRLIKSEIAEDQEVKASNVDHYLDSLPFTAREREIILHLVRFEENKEIADVFGISEHTLQKHLQNLFRKANVSSKWELLRKIYY